MPYICHVDGGGVSLQASAEAIYRIAGRREEQPFSACRPGGGCETMMIHQFQLACSGGKASIAQIAGAARKIGVAFPDGLPSGFAPVGPLAGRFIFPALTSGGTHVTPQVMSQSLSEDSVRDVPAEVAVHVEATGWQTNVNADILPGDAGSMGRVVLVLAAALTVLVAACLVAAGRLRIPVAVSLASFETLTQRWQRVAASVSARWRSRSYAGAGRSNQSLVNAIAIAQARLAEVELNIAALPPDLLLRDVLLSELSRIRPRLAALQKDMHRRAREKSSAMVRVILKDLERIQRIAHGAAASNQPGREPEREAFEIPRSMAEAYRVLGINPDAAPAAAKKLIDALRMSWHPDHARDEDDRARREARMKQINAAWDMINGRRAAA